MTGMDRIIEIDEENLTATVHGGCTWYKLDKELRKRGLTYLRSELGGTAMTVGGSVVKAGAGAIGSCKFGRHGYDDVLGFEAVFPTGDTVKTSLVAYLGTPLFEKLGFGQGLTGLLVGSGGILGILTEITLRVRPVPEVEYYLSFAFNRWEDVEKVGDALTRPIGDELAYSFRAAQAPSLEVEREHGRRTLKIESSAWVCGYSKGEAEFRRRMIKEICSKAGGMEEDPKTAETFYSYLWGFMDVFAIGVHHYNGGYCPIYSLHRYVEAWREIVKKHKFFNNKFGAWVIPRGWGFFVCYMYSEPTERDKIVKIAEELGRRWVDMGSTHYRSGGSESPA